MAAPTGTYQTYQQVGIREDLADKIYDISPTETPFMTMCKVGKKAANTKVEWQTDALAAADATNAVIEGDDATTDTASPTSRLSTHTQIMDKVIRVSETAQAINAAGRKKELAYQIAKRSKELKRDMEARLTGNYASSAGSAAAARTTAGVEAWLETNTSRGTGGSDGGYNTSTGVVDAATDASTSNWRTFTESQLKSVIKSCWENGGEPNIIMVGASNKQTASGFGGIATQYRDNRRVGPASIIAAADVYVSDYGEFKIVPNRFSRDRSALVLDMEYWELRYLQPFNISPLAKTGHSERRLLRAEFALCSKNEGASGIVADLTVS